MKKNLRKRKKGFTLIELVVVIAILGILAAILIPVIGGFLTRANTARDLANAKNLYNCTAMALATGTAVTTGASVPTGVTDLFGPIPSGITIGVVIDTASNSITSATYNGVVYSRATLGS